MTIINEIQEEEETALPHALSIRYYVHNSSSSEFSVLTPIKNAY